MARWIGVGVGLTLVVVVAGWALLRPPRTLLTAGPLQVSNRTTTPLSLWGTRLPRGARVEVSGGAISTLVLEAVRDDPSHLSTALPPVALPPDTARARVTLRVLDDSGRPIAGDATIVVVNDAAFRDPIALAVSSVGQLAAVSPTTDELWIDGRPFVVGDGPRAITTWRHGAESWWVVTLEEEGALRLVSTATPSVTRTISVGGRPRRAVVDERRHVAYVSERVGDVVLEVDLAQGAVRRAIRVDPQPEVLALGDEGHTLWVSSDGAETIAAIDLSVTTATPTVVRVGPGATIIGGPTEPYARYVMSAKPARAMIAVESLGVLFAATLGPNIGPNPDRMEVTMASGVTVVDAESRRFVRHVPLDRGVAQDLAWDARTGRLYVADSAAGRVVVFDGQKLVESDASARVARLTAHELPAPADVPRIREPQELGGPTRATDSLHSGPWSIALLGERLVVLSRFARTLDVWNLEPWAVASRVRVDDRPDTQVTRRRGQIVYFTDLGHSRMTCDTCHPEGGDGGVLFTKGQPIQIHRSPSIRSAHDSAPFFTPAKLASLAVMAKVVLSRNRYEDPVASTAEIIALTEFTHALTAPPNPHRSGPAAALPDEIVLPDGRRGRPRAGRALFEGRAGCAAASCHPPPHFTADQADATRGLFHDVGTPRRIELRAAMQDTAPALLPPPSLLGVWDNHPLLFSGAAGFAVEGDQIVAAHRFALSRALELHERVALDTAELADLTAYLMTL